MTIIDLICPPNECVHVYGRAGAGKTTLGLYLCVRELAAGGVPVFVDATGNLDPEQARLICPSLKIVETAISFRNITTAALELGATMIVVDDLTQFFLSDDAVRKFLSACQARQMRVVMLNQMRIDLDISAAVPYFKNMLDGFGYSIHMFRAEKLANGFIYSLKCEETKEQVEMVISFDGHVDEFFTFRGLFYENLGKMGLDPSSLAGKSIPEQAEFFAQNRAAFDAAIKDRCYLPKTEWI